MPHKGLIRLLVLDDSKFVLDRFTDVAKQVFDTIDINTEIDYSKGLALIDEEQFDVLIIFISCLNSGIQLINYARDVRKIKPPIIAITKEANCPHRETCIKTGADFCFGDMGCSPSFVKETILLALQQHQSFKEIKEEAKQLQENCDALGTFLQNKKEQFTPNEFMSLEKEYESLKKDVGYLLKIVRDGNGRPSLIQSMDQALSKVTNLEEKFALQLEQLETNIALKIENSSLKTSQELGALKASIDAFHESRALRDKFVDKQLEDSEKGDDESENVWGFRAKVGVAIVGAIASIAATVFGYLHQQKQSQQAMQEFLREEIRIMVDAKHKEEVPAPKNNKNND